jgi:hypothetical protein
MRWLRSVLVVGLLAGLGVLVQQAPACACSCMEVTPAEAYAFADAVFIGTAVDVDQPWRGPMRSSADPVTVTFDVTAVSKGAVPANARLQTAFDGASCGYDFVAGTRYLVYVHIGEDGVWTSGLCSGNEVLAAGAQFPSGAAPNGAQAPGPPVDHPSDLPWALIAAAAVVVALVATLVGIAVVRSRRRAAAASNPAA